MSSAYDFVLQRDVSFCIVRRLLTLLCDFSRTWEILLTSNYPALVAGGLAGLWWQMIWCYIGQTFIVISLSEMSSMAPTAGGQYHWVCHEMKIARALLIAESAGIRVRTSVASEDSLVRKRMAEYSCMAILRRSRLVYLCGSSTGLDRPEQPST